MGRELARQFAAAGCHVAMCDVSAGNMEQTRSLCEAGAPAGVRVTTHLADVSVESDVLRFRDEVVRERQADCVHFVFNNAGIAGAGSVIADDRQRWERTFNVCWYGVYYSTRALEPVSPNSPAWEDSARISPKFDLKCSIFRHNIAVSEIL